MLVAPCPVGLRSWRSLQGALPWGIRGKLQCLTCLWRSEGEGRAALNLTFWSGTAGLHPLSKSVWGEARVEGWSWGWGTWLEHAVLVGVC